MLNVILKDLRMLRKNIIIAILFGMTWSGTGVMSKDVFLSMVLQSTSILFIIFFAVISIINYDEKANADIMFNSFPINKSELVLAKYISTIVIMIFSCIFIYLFTNILHLIPSTPTSRAYPLNLGLIIFTIGISLTYHSVYFPLHYYSIGKAKAINTILYFILILIPSIAKKVLGKVVDEGMLNKILDIDWMLLTITLLIASLILYTVSYNISKQIYTKKQF